VGHRKLSHASRAALISASVSSVKSRSSPMPPHEMDRGHMARIVYTPLRIGSLDFGVKNAVKMLPVALRETTFYRRLPEECRKE
jgi:hypothetical protein